MNNWSCSHTHASRTCTDPRDAISTRHDLDADRFCSTTAQTRRVRVSAPLASAASTPITPSSSMRDRTALMSARLHSADAHTCFTADDTVVDASWMIARTTFSMYWYELSTHVRLYRPRAHDDDKSG